MKLTFWGTRGSLAKPGASTVRYGGNTSCVEIVSDAGTLIVIDCGTGAHGLARKLMGEADGPAHGHILISHTHWDHIQGLPFFTPLFIPGNKWEIYGPRGFGEGVRDSLSGQMQYTYFPVTLDALGADVEYHNLVEGSFDVGDVRVRARYLNHPALTLGYRLEVDGVIVVYACDHEPHDRALATTAGEITGEDAEHADFLRGADLVIHDAQYTTEEYPSKVGWGHSTPDYAVRLCRSAGVTRVALTHHEPWHDDDEIDGIVDELRARVATDDEAPIEVFAAAEGQVIELSAEPAPEVGDADEAGPALWVDGDGESVRVLVGMPASAHAELVERAAAAEGIEVTRSLNPEEVAQRFDTARPSLVILEGNDSGLEACRTIRADGDDLADDVPVILVAERAQPDDAVTDWLLKPFSVEYARSRLRAWLTRVECRWVRAPRLAGEDARLAAVHRLQLLDTKPEERFDRITRIAAALFELPMAWVTLMDAERQWFKSRVGVEAEQTPRDQSFCSHAILDPDPLVVPDALMDDRFADSPLVVGPPHVRFYAGCPVIADGEHLVGTLCVADVRARDFTEAQVRLLRDLATLVEAELRPTSVSRDATGG